MHSEKPVALRGTRGARARASSRRRRRPAELRARDAARRGAADGVEARPRRRRSAACAPCTRRRTGAGSSVASRAASRSTRSGPLVDVGVYPLTILTAMFGPVRRVAAYATTLQPDADATRRRRRSRRGARLPRRGARARGRRRRAADGELLGRRPRSSAASSSTATTASLWIARLRPTSTRGWSGRRTARRTRRAARARAVSAAPTGRARSSSSPRRSTEGARTAMGAEHAAHVVEVLDAARISRARGPAPSRSLGLPAARAARLGALSCGPQAAGAIDADPVGDGRDEHVSARDDRLDGAGLRRRAVRTEHERLGAPQRPAVAAILERDEPLLLVAGPHEAVGEGGLRPGEADAHPPAP